MTKRASRFLLICVSLSIIASSLSGCGGTMATAANVLKIAAVKAVLDEGSNSNNTLIRILADIISGNALKEAIAIITRPDDGHKEAVILTLNEDGKYEGSYAAESSPIETTEYSVEVTATDSTGESAVSESVTVEVPADSE